jgi:hypothetical protein
VAALAPSNTERFYCTYNVGGHDHVIICRVTGAPSDSEASEAIFKLFDSVDASLYATNFVKLEKSIIHSNVRNAAVWDQATSWGSGAEPATGIPKNISFRGRDETGHKGGVSVYGWKGFQPDDFRISVGEDADVAAGVLQLEALTNFFISIGGGNMVWHQYANFSLNAYWQRALR